MRPGLVPRFETVAKCNMAFSVLLSCKALFFSLLSNLGSLKVGKRIYFKTFFSKDAFTLGNIPCNFSPQFCYHVSCANNVQCSCP